MMIDKEYYFLLCKDAELNQEKYIEQANLKVCNGNMLGGSDMTQRHSGLNEI